MRTASKKTVETIALSTTGHVATVTIERVGQDVPHNSDDVQVRATIRLPTQGQSSALANELCFGYRVRINESALDAHWESYDGVNKSTRSTKMVFSAPKWAEAELAAQSWAIGQIAKLVSALTVRAAALAEAE